MGRNDKASVSASRLIEFQIVRPDSDNYNPSAIPVDFPKDHLPSHPQEHNPTTTQDADLACTPLKHDSTGHIQSCHDTCYSVPLTPAEQQKEKLGRDRSAESAPLLKALNGSKLSQELPSEISEPSINPGTLIIANGLMSPISPSSGCMSCLESPRAGSPEPSVQNYAPLSPQSPLPSPEIAPEPLTDSEQALNVINTGAGSTFLGNQTVATPSEGPSIAQMDTNSSKPVVDVFDTRDIYHRPEWSQVDYQVVSIEALKLTRAWTSEDLSEPADADSSNERNAPTESRTTGKYLPEFRLLASARTNGTRSGERRFDEVANSSECTLDYAEGEEMDQLCSDILGDLSPLLGNNSET